jgi:tetratricopeptide (TPR) repeat protein
MIRPAALAIAAFLLPAAALAEPEQLRQARNNFEFGKYEEAIRLIDELNEKKLLADGPELVEAYRIHGLSHFYLGHRGEARRSFVKLLSTDPDVVLDSLLVPPLVIEEFEAVKRENEATLGELRRRRQASAEQQRLAEEARRKLIEEADDRRRDAGRPANERVERVEKHNLFATLLPFGVAQFEQGRNTPGALFATAQGLTLFASILSYTQVQDRIEANGRVQANNLTLAQRWRVANWIAFGAAVATYLGGVTDAVVHFQEEKAVPWSPRAPAPKRPGQAGAAFFLAPSGTGVAAGVSGTF